MEFTSKEINMETFAIRKSALEFAYTILSNHGLSQIKPEELIAFADKLVPFLEGK